MQSNNEAGKMEKCDPESNPPTQYPVEPVKHADEEYEKGDERQDGIRGEEDDIGGKDEDDKGDKGLGQNKYGERGDGLPTHKVEDPSQHSPGLNLAQPKANTWRAYANAPNELQVTQWVCLAYYRFRALWLGVFDRRFPFLRFSMGFVLMLLLAIVAYVLAQYFTATHQTNKQIYMGTLVSIIIGLVFSLSTYNSVYCFLIGLSFDRQLFWHKFVAVIGLSAAIVHGVNGISLNRNLATGIPLLAAISVLVVTGLFPYFRSTFFSVFVYIHWLGFITVIVFAALHGAWLVIYIGLAFWGVDMVIRAIIIIRNRKNLKHAVATRLSGSLTRLTFSKGNFKYKAGQYVFISVPKVSYFEWHPFSLSSIPRDEQVTLHIRALGNWTKQLHKKAKSEGGEPLSVYVHGPYGLPAVDIDGPRYKIFLMFTGGIGITPLQSIARDLLHQSDQGRKIVKIMFVWSVRETDSPNGELDASEGQLNRSRLQDLPHAFQPEPSLEASDESELLDTHYHLTGHGNKDNTQEPRLLGRHRHLKHGRPDIAAYCKNAHDLAVKHGVKEIAVLACGPPRMVSDCRSTAHKSTDNSVRFDFHAEEFEL